MSFLVPAKSFTAAVLDASSSPSALLGGDGTLLEVNSTLQQIAGYTPGNELPQLLATPENATTVMRSIKRNRRNRHINCQLASPLNGFLMTSSRVDWSEPCWLIEFQRRAMRNRDFSALNRRHKNGTQLSRENLRLSSRIEQVRTLAFTDTLTTIPNRRAFDEQLINECHNACRYNQPISLAMIDVDYFKQVNDTFGHAQGDQVLKQIAGTLSGLSSQAGGFFARHGGEEFALILPDTYAMTATNTASKAVTMVEALAIRHPKSAVSQCVTISLGFHSIKPANGETETVANELQQGADAALYQAKEAGRNCAFRLGAGMVFPNRRKHHPAIAAQQ